MTIDGPMEEGSPVFHVDPDGETAAGGTSPASAATDPAVFHVDPDRETDVPGGRRRVSGAHAGSAEEALGGLSDFDAGFLLGVLVGEGHFGGDGRSPQVTLRMHVDHENLFHWLVACVPGSRLYGPYDHGGRRYYQWMVRGTTLRRELVPLLDRWLRPEHSGRVHERYLAMKRRYGL